MKTLLLLLLGGAALAQTTRTTVTDTIYDGTGAKVNGSCVFKLASGRAVGAAGAQVAAEPATIRIVDGTFSAQIVPTDTMLPAGQSYAASCTGAKGWAKSGTWVVPTSVTALKWSDIWTAPLPVPSASIPPTQIDASGKVTGVYCLNVVSGRITGLVVCATGEVLAWSALTAESWAALTSGQWAALTL